MVILYMVGAVIVAYMASCQLNRYDDVDLCGLVKTPLLPDLDR